VRPLTKSCIRPWIRRKIRRKGWDENNDVLSLLIRNFDLEKPKQKRLVSQWDLGLVLSALKASCCTETDRINFPSNTPINED
jgi:hypothetical protein